MNAYEIDYNQWLRSQIECLEQGKWDELDVPHLIEELEGLNASNEHALESYLIVLIAHLLKWEFQPQMRSGSWKASINNSRNRIAKLFKRQPSLKNRVVEFIPDAYAEAREWAATETGIREELFPEICPYLALDLLNKGWMP